LKEAEMTRELRCYDYVNAPYEAVCEALRKDARGIFARATDEATGRADELGPTLGARVAGVDVSIPIAIRIGAITSTETYGLSSTRFALSWQGAQRAWLFPTMTAHLDVYPLSAHETQLDLQGTYAPPLGVIGELGDALVAHRVAEAAVQRFLRTVASHMRAHAA
jgi:hypothetical protein